MITDQNQEVPRHLTDAWPVAEGHEVPQEDWDKIVAEVEASSFRRGFVNFSAFKTYSPYPGSGGRKDSGLMSPIEGDDVYVIHTIECPLRAGYAWSLANWSATSSTQASWRGASDPGGFVWYVPKDRSAWHATWVNRFWKGYEQAGYAAYTRSTWLTAEGRSSIDFLAQALVADGISPNSLRRVTDAEIARRKSGNKTPIRGLASHAQIQPENRTDPGAGYPWDLLFERISYHLGATTKPTTPTTTGGFLMALNDSQQEEIYYRVMAGIPDQAARPGNRILDSEDGDYLRILIEGQTAAIRALASSQGANPDAIENAVRESVSKALSELRIVPGGDTK